MVRRRPVTEEEFLEGKLPVERFPAPLALVSAPEPPVARASEPAIGEEAEDDDEPAPPPIEARPTPPKPAKKAKSGRRQDVGDNYEKCTVNFRTSVIERLRITAVMKRRSQVAIIEEALELWYAQEERREKKAASRS
jgi:hypothetical protein